MTKAARACVLAALLCASGCGGQSIRTEGDSANRATGGSAGTSLTGGSAGTIAEGGASGSVGTGGSAGREPGIWICNGFEENLLTSPLHCGSCDMDCRGGACNAGLCTPPPVVIAPLDYEPRPGTRGVALALDATRVYFAEGDTGRIRSVTKDGRELHDLVTGLAEPCDIAVSEAYVYFSTCGDSRVGRVPKEGGASYVFPVVAPDARLAFSDDGALYFAAEGTIQRVAEADDQVTIIARPFAVWPLGKLQVDTSLVYWSVRDLGPELDGIYTMDWRAGEPGRMAALENVFDFVFANFTVYATTRDQSDSGDVIRLPLDAEFPTPLVTGERRPGRLAVDGDAIFYSVEDYDSVLRRTARHGDHIPYALASGHAPGENSYSTIMDMALDETRVFFATATGIESVAKSP
jgi:hypothetical protein